MQFKLTKQLIIKIILWISLWIFIGMLSAPVMAETTVGIRTSKSISYTTEAAIDKTARDEQLKQADADIMPALLTQGFRAESTAMALRVASTSYYVSDSFSIYDAATYLISDFNGDGFYHRFSVTIDADTVYDTARVYAMLYLSYEGGPWNHYATSNSYRISGDSELDIFTIETELADGFAPGYYDVRIELYDADRDTWLFSYGPYDDASLSALPLEDSYYDEPYSTAVYPIETQVIVASQGNGAMSWWLIVIPAVLLALRLTKAPAVK
jgi:hypothetical protein